MNIKKSLKNDDEMNKMLQNVTIGLIAEWFYSIMFTHF